MKSNFDDWITQACAAQRTAELNAFDALAEDNFQPPVLRKKRRKVTALVAVAAAACLLFSTVVYAVWPVVRVRILGKKAYLMAEDAAAVPMQHFALGTLPEGCEATWNPANGYDSCTIRKGAQAFTIVKYPNDHRALLIGDNADGTVTQNDLEGIRENFCMLSTINDLTVENLQEFTVVSWPADDGYFVVLNDSWTEYDQMQQILQDIR